MEKASIEQAAQTINAVIAQARRRQDDQGADGLAAPALITALQAMQDKAQVNSHPFIEWPRWPPGVLPLLAAIYHRLIRRALRWYMYPLAHEQSEFNGAAVAAVESLAREVLELRATYHQERARWQARLEALEAQVTSLPQPGASEER